MGFRQEVRRAEIKQQIKHEEKFIASVLGVKPRKIFMSLPTLDGFGWAAYYHPAIPDKRVVWLTIVSTDGVVHGDPLVFQNQVYALSHGGSGQWEEHYREVYASLLETGRIFDYILDDG